MFVFDLMKIRYIGMKVFVEYKMISADIQIPD
jgi:hypothetical protein